MNHSVCDHRQTKQHSLSMYIGSDWAALEPHHGVQTSKQGDHYGLDNSHLWRGCHQTCIGVTFLPPVVVRATLGVEQWTRLHPRCLWADKDVLCDTVIGVNVCLVARVCLHWGDQVVLGGWWGEGAVRLLVMSGTEAAASGWTVAHLDVLKFIMNGLCCKQEVRSTTKKQVAAPGLQK